MNTPPKLDYAPRNNFIAALFFLTIGFLWGLSFAAVIAWVAL